MLVATSKKSTCFHGLSQVLLLWSCAWTSVSASLTHTRAAVGGLPDATDLPSQASVAHGQACATAVLISGQQYRFIYQDGALQKGLDRLLGKDETFDIHAVIAKTGRAENVWMGSIPEFPPYSMDHADIADFLSRRTSAKHVNITLVEKDALLDDLQEVRNLSLNHEARLTSKPVGLLEHTIRNGHGGLLRFEANTMMLHLRHLAYMQALSSELVLPYKYQAFLVLREDNTFLGPNLGPCVGCAFKLVSSDCQASDASPVVLADQNCVWGTRLSDKIFFANRAAASLMWKDSRQGHIEHIASFIGPMVKNGTYPFPMQTESWIDKHLVESNIELIVLDFQRIDKRYVTQNNTYKPLLCVPKLYSGCNSWLAQETVPICSE